MDHLVIAFVTGGLKFNGDTLKTKGLGGSETALICMARAMADRGHRVSVFCNTDNPGNYDGVSYYDRANFSRVCSVTNWDVLISSRLPEYTTIPSLAGLRILWLHDTLTDKNRLLAHSWQTDAFFLLSDYHIQDYTVGKDEKDTDRNKAHEILPHVWKTSNGIDMNLIDANRRPKVPGKVIYTSRPERGLPHLLHSVMPKLIEARPDIKLHYANYSLAGLTVPDHVRQAVEMSDYFAKKMPDHVVNMGHLTKDRLYQEMSSAEVFLYPTSFPEIFCISVLEAQACGTPVITTKDFALTETVGKGCGFLVDGKPEDGDVYFDKFIRKSLIVLNDPITKKKMQEEGPAFAETRTWDAIAETWEVKFFEMMENRFQTHKKKVIQELVRRHDLVRARELCESNLSEEESFIDACIMDVEHAEPEQDADKILLNFRSSLPRFQKVWGFMQARGVKSKVLWDYACGDGAFALYAAKSDSNLRCVVLDRVKDVADRAVEYAKRSHLENVYAVRGFSNPGEVVIDDGKERPDCVFLGNFLDTTEDPAAWLNAFAKILPTGGHIVFTVRSGPTTATTPNEHHRCWDFDQTDFHDMFGKDFVGHLTFEETGVTPGGDLQGIWYVIIPIPEEGVVVTKPNPRRRALTTRPYQSIAACVISYNDEDWITRFLKPLIQVCDRIYITVDSRTDDNTRRLIGLLDPHGDHIAVREREFDDFASQRNFSKRGVKEDWILWIDTDEILVEGPKLRKYIHGCVMNGFSIRQNHLMLDVHGTSDVPIRLLRNYEHYKFIGCIHEHCEDTSKPGTDNAIRPAMLIQDVDLAHYGYINEAQRRRKCSNRNMRLLQRDFEVNPERGLTKVLAIRDYINIVKWQAERDKLDQRGIAPGSEPHHLLEAAIKMYLHFFADPDVKYHDLVWPMYQEALSFLAVSGIPFENRTTPPFSVASALSAAIGGPANTNIKPSLVWFIDDVDYRDYVARQHAGLLREMGMSDEVIKGPPPVDYCYSDEVPKLLSLGTDVIDEMTGRLM